MDPKPTPVDPAIVQNDKSGAMSLILISLAIVAVMWLVAASRSPAPPAGSSATYPAPARTAAPPVSTGISGTPDELLRNELKIAKLVIHDLNAQTAAGQYDDAALTVKLRAAHLETLIQQVRSSAAWSDFDRNRVLEPLKEEFVHWKAWQLRQGRASDRQR